MILLSLTILTKVFAAFFTVESRTFNRHCFAQLTALVSVSHPLKLWLFIWEEVTEQFIEKNWRLILKLELNQVSQCVPRHSFVTTVL